MRNWLTVDLKKIESNLETVRAVLPEECGIIAVVKANAYGHGDVKISLALEEMGVSKFAVASFGEAQNLRDAGISGEILVLSYVDPKNAVEAYTDGITLAGISDEYVKKISAVGVQKGIRIRMHLKLNTGMNRVGFECGTEDELKKIANAYSLPGIEISGIFSHFSSADDLSDGAEEYTRAQIKKFDKAISYLKMSGIDPGICHISNSGGIGKYKEARYDAVRCGALLYGYNTAADAKLEVRPAAEWKAAISCVRTLKAGDAVSYSRHYIAKGGEKIATICVGYADGYKRAMSGREDGPHGYVLIGGKKCPIVGNICMDQMMADVSGLDVNEGDVAILMGEGLDADELAEYSGTCMHDILASIGPRVERIYKDLI